MVGVNKVILIGNLGRNPDVVAFPQDRNDDVSSVVKKASFPLATTEFRRNRDGERVEQTEWHNVVCWRALAEIAERYFAKERSYMLKGNYRPARGKIKKATAALLPKWWQKISPSWPTRIAKTSILTKNKTLYRLY